MLGHLLGRIKERIWDTGKSKLPESLDDLPGETVAGSWQATCREADRSLIISGKLESPAKTYLMFKGRLLGIAAPDASGFRFLVLRAGRKGLAPDARFEVATDEGIVPHLSGETSWRVSGEFVATTGKFLDLDRHIDRGDRLTKKGTLAPRSIPDEKKERYCKLVRRLDDWFLENRGRPTLVSHGTLLGLYRDGDMVPYDDDFDSLYLSRHDSVDGVIEERLEIVTGLLRAGFTCRMGKTGHIKVRNKYVEVDLMPAWIEDDVLHVSCYSQIPGASTFVEPPSAISWGQHGTFSTFAQPEKFLEAQYGPEWRSPDPGYRSELTPRGKRNRKLLAPAPETLAVFREVRDECAKLHGARA